MGVSAHFSGCSSGLIEGTDGRGLRRPGGSFLCSERREATRVEICGRREGEEEEGGRETSQGPQGGHTHLGHYGNLAVTQLQETGVVASLALEDLQRGKRVDRQTSKHCSGHGACSHT